MTDSRTSLPFNLQINAVQRAAALLRLGTTAETFLETEKLHLRTWQIKDLADLLVLDGDRRVTRHLIDASVADRDQALAFMAVANALAEVQPGLGIWRAADRDNDHFLGYFLLAPDPDGHVEVGARLVPAAWGRGYGLDGTHSLCEHAFGKLALNEIWGFCKPDNLGAALNLLRLRFELQGNMSHLGSSALGFRLCKETHHAHPEPLGSREAARRLRATVTA